MAKICPYNRDSIGKKCYDRGGEELGTIVDVIACSQKGTYIEIEYGDVFKKRRSLINVNKTCNCADWGYAFDVDKNEVRK